jgi:hypothetical protein
VGTQGRELPRAGPTRVRPHCVATGLTVLGSVLSEQVARVRLAGSGDRRVGSWVAAEVDGHDCAERCVGAPPRRWFGPDTRRRRQSGKARPKRAADPVATRRRGRTCVGGDRITGVASTCARRPFMAPIVRSSRLTGYGGPAGRAEPAPLGTSLHRARRKTGSGD